jgi:hypothetical protein
MSYEFHKRSQFVPPMFYGGAAGAIEVGDQVELHLDEIRVRMLVDQVSGAALTGTVQTLADDVQQMKEYQGLAAGVQVPFGQEHVRACWKKG